MHQEIRLVILGDLRSKLCGVGRLAHSALRENHAIYIVGSGQINVARLTPSNVERVAEAIRTVGG